MEFHNFRDTYPIEEFPNLEERVCGGNKVFRTNNGAAESTSGHYLRNVKCTNCDRDGLAFLMEPLEKWRGWFGGCG